MLAATSSFEPGLGAQLAMADEQPWNIPLEGRRARLGPRRLLRNLLSSCLQRQRGSRGLDKQPQLLCPTPSPSTAPPRHQDTPQPQPPLALHNLHNFPPGHGRRRTKHQHQPSTSNHQCSTQDHPNPEPSSSSSCHPPATSSDAPLHQAGPYQGPHTPWASTMQLVDSCMDIHMHAYTPSAKAAAAQQGLPPLHRDHRGSRRGPLRRLGRLLARLGVAVGRAISPKGPGDNDSTPFERVINVLTCVPFFMVGNNFLRHPPRQGYAGFGHAMRAIGTVAAIYHGSSGRVRPSLRKADYWCIAVTSALLRAAAVGRVPRAVTAAMLAVIPVKPTLVTGANLMAVEAKYAALALSRTCPPALRRAWAAHVAISATATASFSMESRMEHHPLGPLAHACWHCMSAGATLSMGRVMHAAEAARV